MKNLTKYESDLNKLLKKGDHLYDAILFESGNNQYYKQYIETLESRYPEYVSDIEEMACQTTIDFKSNYQHWYTECLCVIKILLPDRTQDFIRCYNKDPKRKSVNNDTYTIEDYYQNIKCYKHHEDADYSPAVHKFKLQLEIVKSISQRFASTLFQLEQLMQSDLFDNEVESAEYLLKNGYLRASGVILGVVIESHLSNVVKSHSLTINKKAPSIADYNELLKSQNILDTQVWRKIQSISDIRNKCSHKKLVEPVKDEIEEMIRSVKYIIHNIF